MISKDDMEQFHGAMELVRDVHDGKIEKPGGQYCFFPDCGCQLPWSKCERATSFTGQPPVVSLRG